MAAASLPIDYFHTNADDEHHEIFGVIWLDDSTNAKE
ncbi:unnamed protein product, partial [Rotaria sp. Silwood1]